MQHRENTILAMYEPIVIAVQRTAGNIRRFVLDKHITNCPKISIPAIFMQCQRGCYFFGPPCKCEIQVSTPQSNSGYPQNTDHSHLKAVEYL